MCGIAGIVAHDALTDAERGALEGMMERLAHRGPDGAGRYDDRQAALGHRRLSVIDIEGGRQPVGNESGSVRAVVNGEFYNFRELRGDLIGRGHRLRACGDSEVLPHLYEDRGESCLHELVGMFALCIWDASNRAAFLARDRLGVKPLYVHVDDRRLVFGSELKAVLAAPGVPREIDATAVLDFMTFGFIPSPKTIFRDIIKLPPGHSLTYRDGRAAIRRYWELSFVDRPQRTELAESEGLWNVLGKATQQRLIADVPIGAFLSGGLDSAAVVETMRQSANVRPVTVTCGFEERGFDERAQARDVASFCGTAHHEEVVRGGAEGILDALAWHFDEPFADPSAIPMYHISQNNQSEF